MDTIDAMPPNAAEIIRSTTERRVRRLTTFLRGSQEPYWECLRRRLQSDHAIAHADSVLLDVRDDQGGDAGWLATSDYRLIDFTYDFSVSPHVDEDIGRFTGWAEDSFADDPVAMRAFEQLVTAVS